MRGPPRIDLTMIGRVCEKDLQSLNIFPRMFLNAVITFRHSLRMQFIAGRKNSYYSLLYTYRDTIIIPESGSISGTCDKRRPCRANPDKELIGTILRSGNRYTNISYDIVNMECR